MEVVVRVESRPTEDLEKVKKALLNVFAPDGLEVREEGEYRYVVAFGKSYASLLRLYNLIRSQRILDAARDYLRRGIAGDSVVFYLHKQAAYVGVASFCSFEYGESPLGAIVFEVKTGDIQRFIDWLAPKTIGGRPVGEAPPPDDP